MSNETRSTTIVTRDDPPVDRFYRLSPGQYRRMFDDGVLMADDPTELIEGIIRVKGQSSGPISSTIYRLSVDQYDRAGRAGILNAEDRVELLEGWLVVKMTKNPPHTIAAGLLNDELLRLVPEGWYIANQDPIATLDSQPEPDLMVVRGRRRDYRDGHPGPRDVTLVVEVADSTLSSDRTTKKRIYARAEIPTYWIVNLIAGQVEVHTTPTDGLRGYARRDVYGPDDEVPVVLDGREVGRITAREILP